MSHGDALARVREALEARGCTISAQCPVPAHDDHRASLSVGQGRKGALVNCHGPCGKDEVLEALGMSAADLFDEPRGRGNGTGYTVTATYTYTDGAGSPLFYVERRMPKDFRQYHIRDGRKIWNLDGVQRVIYQLPRVIEAVARGQTVYIVEGEKDVHAIEAAGAVATCNPGGAQKWRGQTYNSCFTGADVVIVADADRTGHIHAMDVAGSLEDVAASVTIVGPAEGCKDASDHLDAGHGLGDFCLIDQSGTTGRRLILTRASDIEPEPVVWAWEDSGQGRMPSGSLSLFAGREGTGKSSFLIWLAARITTGTLPGSLDGPRAVIYVAVEDSWKYTIVPRLIAAAADLDLVYRAEVAETDDGTVSLSLPADSCLLEDAIISRGVAMVALDPLMSAISDTLDTHVNRQVRQALDPLARMADRTGAVVAGIAHFNKSGGTDASSLITASGAFKDVARSIFAFAADDDDGSKVITQTKNNLGRSDLPSLAYRIIEAIVPTARGDARVGRFVLDGETGRTVRDILSDQAGVGTERSEKTRADDYLRTTLASGPRPTREVEEEAREAHQISKRTLQRARTSLRIPSAKHGAIWWISLPEHEGDLTNAAFISAKHAKSSSPDGDGGVGGVEP
jgi:sugar phosphate isomerase/epimerase